MRDDVIEFEVVLPEGAKSIFGPIFFSKMKDGSRDIYDEDMAAIELVNGYTIDCGAYGAANQILVVVHTKDADWDDAWERIECENVDEAAALIVKLCNKWLKRPTVDPRIIEGNKAKYEWKSHYSIPSAEEKGFANWIDITPKPAPKP